MHGCCGAVFAFLRCRVVCGTVFEPKAVANITVRASPRQKGGCSDCSGCPWFGYHDAIESVIRNIGIPAPSMLNSTALNGHNANLPIRSAPPPFPSARAALAPPGVWHCERRRRRLCSQAPAAAPCRRPQPSSRSPRARASRSSSRRASPRPATAALGRAGPPRCRPPPRLSK